MLCDGADSTSAVAGTLGASEAGGSPGAGHAAAVTGAAGVVESTYSTDAADVSWYSVESIALFFFFNRLQK